MAQGHYQKQLLSKIFDLKDRGMNTGEIARRLAEMGYLSVRGKSLLSKHIWSMIKKNSHKVKNNNQFQKKISNIYWEI